MEAAAAVNDGSALDTPIQGHEAALTAGLASGDSPGPSELGAKTPATNATPSQSGLGSRELIWKTAEGTEKRLVLPIEIIQEDVMDDPERLLSEVDRGNMSDDEWNKMLAAI